jgi:hypothetical protein
MMFTTGTRMRFVTNSLGPYLLGSIHVSCTNGFFALMRDNALERSPADCVRLAFNTNDARLLIVATRRRHDAWRWSGRLLEPGRLDLSGELGVMCRRSYLFFSASSSDTSCLVLAVVEVSEDFCSPPSTYPAIPLRIPTTP